MTQQPMPYPQQPYPPQQPQAYPAPAPYPTQQPQQYPPQGYPQQGGYPPQAPQQPAVPLAEGSLDAFYSQPSVGGGPSLGWSSNGQQKPIGTTYTGVVAADINSTNVRQETDQQTNAPKFYRDGRPKFVMLVPMGQVRGNFQTPTGLPEYPEGEATWWCKGQGRDELTRAMAEAGVQGAPKKGAVIQITLINRKQGKAGQNPANVVQIVYTPAGTEQKLEGAAPAVAQPAQAPAPQAYRAAAPAPQVQQQAYQAAAPAPQVQQPQMQAPAPQPPAGPTPEAAQILQGLGVQPQQNQG